MTPEQYVGLAGRLDAILMKMPAVPQLEDRPSLVSAGEDPDLGTTTYRKGAYHALRSMLEVLDGWIKGQQSNHQGSGHRHENRGEECWRLWAPSDIRRMVNDAAREVGLSEFPLPKKSQEDKRL